MSYVSGQIGRSARANLGHRHDKAYIGTDALRKSKSLIRLDFLLNDYNAIEPLDEARFHDPRRRFLAEATDAARERPSSGSGASATSSPPPRPRPPCPL